MTPITAGALRYLITDWQSDGPVLLASPYPDCSLGLEQAMVAGVSEDGRGLCLYPEPREVPLGSLAPNASALDVAAAAIRYQLSTPFLRYDPDVANQLFYRAVVAIEQTQALAKRLAS
jgi:hypothetical protein